MKHPITINIDAEKFMKDIGPIIDRYVAECIEGQPIKLVPPSEMTDSELIKFTELCHEELIKRDLEKHLYDDYNDEL